MFGRVHLGGMTNCSEPVQLNEPTELWLAAITVPRLAKLAGIHVRTLYRLIESGELHAAKVGRVYRIPLREAFRLMGDRDGRGFASAAALIAERAGA